MLAFSRRWCFSTVIVCFPLLYFPPFRADYLCFLSREGEEGGPAGGEGGLGWWREERKWPTSDGGWNQGEDIKQGRQG